MAEDGAKEAERDDDEEEDEEETMDAGRTPTAGLDARGDIIVVGVGSRREDLGKPLVAHTVLPESTGMTIPSERDCVRGGDD